MFGCNKEFTYLLNLLTYRVILSSWCGSCDFTLVHLRRLMTFVTSYWCFCFALSPGGGCDVEPVRNGFTRSRYGGGLMVFRCRKGYHLTGPRTLACIEGEWNGTHPVCKSKSIVVR